MIDKENFVELIWFHRFSFDMVGMEENLNISLSLGDWVGNASKRVGVPGGWSFQVDGVSKWVGFQVCVLAQGSKCVFWLRGPSGWGVQVCVLAQGSKWVRGPSVCFGSGVQVGEASKWVGVPSGWGVQVCVLDKGSKWVRLSSVCLVWGLQVCAGSKSVRGPSQCEAWSL